MIKQSEFCFYQGSTVFLEHYPDVFGLDLIHIGHILLNKPGTLGVMSLCFDSGSQLWQGIGNIWRALKMLIPGPFCSGAQFMAALNNIRNFFQDHVFAHEAPWNCLVRTLSNNSEVPTVLRLVQK